MDYKSGQVFGTTNRSKRDYKIKSIIRTIFVLVLVSEKKTDESCNLFIYLFIYLFIFLFIYLFIFSFKLAKYIQVLRTIKTLLAMQKII